MEYDDAVMTLAALLAPERARIVRGTLGRAEALESLADLLARDGAVDAAEVTRALREREAVQSTGLGEGVAIPHAALSTLSEQRAALLIVPAGVDFDAVDGEKVRLFVAVVGPRTTSGEHLRTLARLSRLFRSRLLRERLVAAETSGEAYDALLEEDLG